MAVILTKCPETQTRVPTGQHATVAQFEAGPLMEGRFRCTACNQVHRWTKAEAWLAQRGDFAV